MRIEGPIRGYDMAKVLAVYENGVFRPKGPVDLPDPCEVEFEPQLVEPDRDEAALKDVYAILSERYQSGESDVAARHDEHQS